MEEQNFSTLIEMINSMEVREDDEEFKNAVDLMFDELKERNPHHFAVRQYAKYKLAAGKTAKSILVSCGARLAVFDIAELREVTAYDELELDKLDCTVAIIKNARSNKMGRKDILKVECDIDKLDLDVLAFIDHNITVNVIKNCEIVEKKELVLPKEVKNVIRCRNPRCITSIEQGLPHIFVLSDEKKEIYRCKYCEEKVDRKKL